ncbi:MAG: outer membrane beta-barrel protein [Ginsengibacter sp.]
MKKIKTVFALMSAFMFVALTTNAQKGTLQMNLNYNYGIPSGSFNSDLISNGSPRGGRGSIMYNFTDHLSAGLESGYQDFYQKYPRDLYHLSNSQDVSAVLSNSIQTTPLLIKAKYALTNNSGVKPYVSLAAGANMINFRQYFGEFSNTQTSTGFLAQGGLGVMIPFSKSGHSGINIGASYDYAPYNKNGYTNLNTINLQAGVIFPIH